MTPDEARRHCCDTWPKPCSYHGGYADGWEAALAPRPTRDMGTLVSMRWALAVYCRYCKAVPGSSCTTSSGTVAYYPHGNRCDDAKAAGLQPPRS